MPPGLGRVRQRRSSGSSAYAVAAGSGDRRELAGGRAAGRHASETAKPSPGLGPTSPQWRLVCPLAAPPAVPYGAAAA